MLVSCLELTKSRITSRLILATLIGLWLRTAGSPVIHTALLMLLGTALVLAAAKFLNMYFERETDALMPRRINRLLPEGRIGAQSINRTGNTERV